MGSKKKFGYFRKDHEGQGERSHPTLGRATWAPQQGNGELKQSYQRALIQLHAQRTTGRTVRSQPARQEASGVR